MRNFFISAAVIAVAAAQSMMESPMVVTAAQSTMETKVVDCAGQNQQGCDKMRNGAPYYYSDQKETEQEQLQLHEQAYNYLFGSDTDSDSSDSNSGSDSDMDGNTDSSDDEYSYNDSEVKSMQAKIISSMDDWSSSDIEMMQQRLAMANMKKRREKMEKERFMRKERKRESDRQMKFMAKTVMKNMPDSQAQKFQSEFNELFGNISMGNASWSNASSNSSGSGEDDYSWKPIVTLGEQINPTKWLASGNIGFSTPNQTVINSTYFDLKNLWVSEISTNAPTKDYYSGYFWAFNLNDGTSLSYMDYGNNLNRTVLKLNQEDQPIKEIVMIQDQYSLTGIQIKYFSDEMKDSYLGSPDDSDTRIVQTLKKNQRLLGFKGLYQQKKVSALVNLQPYIITYEP